jgi:hypothetical protein
MFQNLQILNLQVGIDRNQKHPSRRTLIRQVYVDLKESLICEINGKSMNLDYAIKQMEVMPLVLMEINLRDGKIARIPVFKVSAKLSGLLGILIFGCFNSSSEAFPLKSV